MTLSRLSGASRSQSWACSVPRNPKWGRLKASLDHLRDISRPRHLHQSPGTAKLRITSASANMDKLSDVSFAVSNTRIEMGRFTLRLACTYRANQSNVVSYDDTATEFQVTISKDFQGALGRQAD